MTDKHMKATTMDEVLIQMNILRSGLTIRDCIMQIPLENPGDMKEILHKYSSLESLMNRHTRYDLHAMNIHLSTMSTNIQSMINVFTKLTTGKNQLNNDGSKLNKLLKDRIVAIFSIYIDNQTKDADILKQIKEISASFMNDLSKI